ncbi:hypothetical protein [Sorlinia euscelidii]|uniref:Beta-glucosidase n=1 Tax=Sorlinia euscelidii TaxID=3081148 RepID=A0ABU7U497_9PROT
MKRKLAAVMLATACLTPVPISAHAQQVWKNPDATPSERVEALLKAMTLDEKFVMLTSEWGVPYKNHRKPPKLSAQPVTRRATSASAFRHYNPLMRG